MGLYYKPKYFLVKKVPCQTFQLRLSFPNARTGPFSTTPVLKGLTVELREKPGAKLEDFQT